MFINLKVRNWFLGVLWLIYTFFVVWFLCIYLRQSSTDPINLYSNSYGIIPLLGGAYGLFVAKHWGGLKSKIGKAITFLSLGLLTWGMGIVIWLYYNIVLHVEVPYPSLADVAFILSWPLWGMGATFLSKATGATFGLKELRGRIMMFVVPVFAVIFSYYFLVTIARRGVISTYEDFFKTFFDLAYPIGDVVILTIGLLIFGLSYKYFGGLYKTGTYFILFAFVVNYFADFTFSYSTSLGTYYNGSFADFLFATTMTILSTGVALLNPQNTEENKPV